MAISRTEVDKEIEDLEQRVRSARNLISATGAAIEDLGKTIKAAKTDERQTKHSKLDAGKQRAH